MAREHMIRKEKTKEMVEKYDKRVVNHTENQWVREKEILSSCIEQRN